MGVKSTPAQIKHQEWFSSSGALRKSLSVYSSHFETLKRTRQTCWPSFNSLNIQKWGWERNWSGLRVVKKQEDPEDVVRGRRRCYGVCWPKPVNQHTAYWWIIFIIVSPVKEDLGSKTYILPLFRDHTDSFLSSFSNNLTEDWSSGSNSTQ